MPIKNATYSIELPKKYIKLIAKYAFIQNMAFVIGIGSYFLGGWLVKIGYNWIGTFIVCILPPLCGMTAILTPRLFIKEYERIKRR